ncbi:MAG: hypothetical protein DHS20C16_01250 [Phycisphaerae bacterium]|nr:MAG: hypothetical protein DHS20C16_01250 [Phycisphaerae bacterium]
MIESRNAVLILQMGLYIGAVLLSPASMLLASDQSHATELAKQCDDDAEGKDGLCGHALRAMVPPPVASLRGSDAEIDVVHCFLDIELGLNPNSVTGSNTLDIVSLSDGLTSITLDLFDVMVVGGVWVDGSPVSYLHANDQIDIDLGQTFDTDEAFSVRVEYGGAPFHLSAAAGYSGTHGSPAVEVIATHSQPFNAPAWWPCKNAIDDKFTMDVWVTSPDWMTVASNGRFDGVDVLSGNRARYRWAETYPISVYLVSIAATNYTHWTESYVHSSGVMPVDFYIYPEDVSTVQPLLVDVVSMIETFSHPDCFGEYPFLDEKYGIAQFEGCCGMEHQTITSQGSFPERRTVHELAHMWWGDAVTCATWHDIWLNEGFARYAESLWHERKPGGSHAAYLSHMMTYRPSSFGGTVYRYDINTTSQIFSVTNVYNKASWVMHMLRHVLGDDVFYDVLAEYRSTYEDGSATTADFQAVVEMVSGREMDWFFDQWVYQGGAPSYRFGWQSEFIGNQHRLLLHVEQYQTAYPSFTMPIDVVVEYADASSETFVISNDREFQWFIVDTPKVVVDVQLDPDTWILRGAMDEVAYVSGCNQPSSDLNGDARVDLRDFAMLQICTTGDGGGPIGEQLCTCFDRDGDDDIDAYDYGAFMQCLDGPAMDATACVATVELFADDFDTDTSSNWNINVSGPDTSIAFAYDYGVDGIPSAPNSTGGTTLGLRLAANLTSPGDLEAVSLSPVGASASGQYTLAFDMWINANGPFPSGGTGSTEFITGGVGSDGMTVNLGGVSGFGAWFAVDGEGGSSRDFRVYKDATEQSIASGIYNVASNNNTDPTLSGFFAPQSPPVTQQVIHAQQSGMTAAGSAGFQWREFEVVVDEIAGTATWRIDGLTIATIDNNSGLFVSLSGDITIGYMDGFTSVSDNAALSFGLIDNLRVNLVP